MVHVVKFEDRDEALVGLFTFTEFRNLLEEGSKGMNVSHRLNDMGTMVHYQNRIVELGFLFGDERH